MRTWFATPPKLGGSMKRLSIIMLALLFVAGSLLAVDVDISVSGDAKAEFKMDFAGETAGIINTSNVKADFNVVLGQDSGETKGSGAMWAEIKGSASISAKKDNAVNNDPVDFTLKASLAYARIWVDELWINILGAPKSFDYAKSPFGKDSWGETNAAAFGDGSGLTIGLPNKAEIGFFMGADWSGADTDLEYLASVKMPVVVSPELTAEVMGAAYSFDGADFAFSAGFKADYAMDGMAFHLAGDFIDNFDKIDLLVRAVVAPLTVSAFVNTDAEILEAKAVMPLPVAGVDSLVLTVDNQMDYGTFKDKFQVKLDAKVDLLTVGVWGGFTMTTALDEWNTGVKGSYIVDAWTLAGQVEFVNDVQAATLTVPASAKVTSSNLLIDKADVFAEWKTSDVTDLANAGTHFMTVGVSTKF